MIDLRFDFTGLNREELKAQINGLNQVLTQLGQEKTELYNNSHDYYTFAFMTYNDVIEPVVLLDYTNEDGIDYVFSVFTHLFKAGEFTRYELAPLKSYQIGILKPFANAMRNGTDLEEELQKFIEERK